MDQTYTIKEVAKLFNLSVSTLHYYDKCGLLPFVSKNEMGYREFTKADLGFIKTITCLKNTDMPIKEINQYIKYCMEGPVTINQREQLLKQHRQNVLAKQQKIMESLQEIDHKIERYQSKNAYDLIEQQLNFAINEKKEHNLKNPFTN